MVTTSSCRSNGTNRCTHSRNLTLFGLRNEREISIVTRAAKQREDNDIGDPPVIGVNRCTKEIESISHLDVKERTLWLYDFDN